MITTFNLLYEPWIPAVTLDGRAVQVSLREALENAPRYRAISASLPHTSAAVLRLLLAVLHRVFGPDDTPDWEALWLSGAFDADRLEAYFQVWRPRFDLFSAERPFFQCRHPEVEEKPIQALLQMTGGGDTFTLFDHVLDDTPVALTPAEAALALVTTQAFGLAGLCHPQKKLVYTDGACSRAIVFFVEGKTLFETLMFNLVSYNSAEPIPWNRDTPDRPFWEAEDPYQPRNLPLGYLDLLTWPNRKIMLLPEVQNGQTMVTRVTTAPGLVLAAESHNPMYHYSRVPGRRTGEVITRVIRFNEGRALWRDSHALMDLHNQAVDPPQALIWINKLVNDGILPHRRLKLAAFGMCTEPGKQKVYFYRGDSFEFSDQLLEKDELVKSLGTALRLAEDLYRKLNFAVFKLAEQVISANADQEDGRKPDTKDVQNLMDHWNAGGLYWNRLEIPFYQFLNQLPDAPEEASDAWRKEIIKAMHNTFDQVSLGLGTGQKALKATAKARGWIGYGIHKVLESQP